MPQSLPGSLGHVKKRDISQNISFQKTQGCEWWTFYDDTKMCAGFTGCIDRSIDHCEDCTSGERECPEFQCALKGRCLGALEGVRVSQSATECSEVCAADEACKWFSFDRRDGGLCSLTNDCPVLDKTCHDGVACTAYERACDMTAAAKEEEENALDDEDASLVVTLFANSEGKGLLSVTDLTGKGLDKGCPTVPFPDATRISYPSVGNAGGFLSVCGGNTDDVDCQLFNHEAGKWEKAEMDPGTVPTFDAKYAVIGEGDEANLWIGAAGQQNDYMGNQTFVFDGMSMRDGPALAFPTGFSKLDCASLVDLGGRSVAVLGGVYTSKTKRVPNMKIVRYHLDDQVGN